MWNLVGKLVKWSLAVAATLVIVVAIGVGGFRLLMTQLPAYQDDLQAWVQDALGLEVNFDRLDTRWGLRGPELTFYGASVRAAGQDTPFLVARQAALVLSPFALLARRELDVKRLTFEGTELTVVRTAEGQIRLEGAPVDSAQRQDFSFDFPPEVEVVVRDSRVLYLDQARDLSWEFQGVTVSLNRDATTLALELRARPPGEFANRIELEAVGSLEQGAQLGGDWRLVADIAGADLGVLARSLPADATFPRAGTGDLSVSLQTENGRIARSAVAFSLSNVALSPRAEDPDPSFTWASGTAEWRQESDHAWRLALRDIELSRAGSGGPSRTSAELALEVDPNARELRAVTLRADFLRLEDLAPFASLLPASLDASTLIERWRALAPRGDVADLELSIARAASGQAEPSWEYTAAGRFDGLGVRPFGDWPGVAAVAGELRADSRSGRLDLRTHDALIAWPSVFRAPLPLAEASGIVVWRRGQDATRIVSDDLLVATPDGATRSNLELTLPLDGSSPRLDLHTNVSELDVVAVKRYLPAHKMPRGVVDWLDSALEGGRVQRAELSLFGPLAAFPFDGGEGELSVDVEVTDGVLAFVNDWPRAEQLTGTVEFRNARFAAHGSGRVLGNESSDVAVEIADLRKGVLTLRGSTIGPLADVLAFFNDAPLIARELGPYFGRLEAPVGTARVGLDLTLPLLDMDAFDLSGELAIADGEIAVDGFEPRVSEVRGTIRLADGAITGEDLEAVFLDGPVTARVLPPDAAGYRARLEVDGEVTTDAVLDAFDLPLAGRVAGQTRWNASFQIPVHHESQPAPTRIRIGSNLSGVALRLPTPFAKTPAEPTNLQLDVALSAEDRVEVQGYLGASRRFALLFEGSPGGGLRFERGALRFGGELPEIRSDRGLTIDGSLPHLPLDDWLSLGGSFKTRRAASRGADDTRAGEDRDGSITASGDAPRAPGDASGGGERGSPTWFAGADLTIADFSAFGQQLGTSRVAMRRRTDDWQIEVDSEPIAGTMLVPADLTRRPRVVAIMKRLYLTAGGAAADESSAASRRGAAAQGAAARRGLRGLDPRDLPGLQLHSDEFGIGGRRLGRLDAEIVADPLGLRLVSLESSTASFNVHGSGGWFVDTDGDTTTRLALSLSSTKVAAMLEELGFDPALDAELADATASIYWPGPPSGDWMQHVSGDVALSVGTGSLLDVEPGAGRVLGLMSITALPRRLSLDFRDVFNKGFVFDNISADFTLVDGNAYTDNLKLTGPTAEIGVVGRTGLRDRDYRQQAVITSEPGKVLPTVGGLLGGPGVAAALLIFTRIFKEPLKGIGRASYCVTGPWHEPVVERLTAEQLERGELCAELPPGALAARVLQRGGR